MEELTSNSERPASRRSFLKKSLVAGAAATVGAGILSNGLPALAHASTSKLRSPTATLRSCGFWRRPKFSRPILWLQYAELGGVTAGTQNPYQLALQQLDGDGSQYITSNTLDEMSHAIS